MKNSLKLNIKKINFYVTFFLLLVPILSIAQNTNNQQIKRLQRAIYVFNFAEQVTWQDKETHTNFKIGVLGPDRTEIDLSSLATKRKINNKKVQIVSFNNVKDITGINLLYVNKALNFDIDYILNKISNKNILLVSEGYSFKSSMINMVNIGDTFEYEINKTLLNKENFIIANSLNKYSISTSEKWKKLFKTTEASLKESRKLTAKKQVDINKQQLQINSDNNALANQKQTIENQQNSIKNASNLDKQRIKQLEHLSHQNNLQKEKLETKLDLERELEATIQAQIKTVKTQEKNIKNSALKIVKQQENITQQELLIDKNTLVLENKNQKIKSQKQFNHLLIGVIILSFLGVFLLYRNYKTKKESAHTLKLKNNAILKQSLLLEVKNKELEEFAYIASHDLKEPLITISSLIDILVDDYCDKFDKESRLSLNYIKESSDRMKQLIEAILSYSRLGKTKEYAKVDCNSLIKVLKTDLQNIFSRTETELVVNELPILTGSALEIRLLFQNLISNAIKFTKPETTPIVTINAEKITIKAINYWKFSVADNGIGILEKHKERIFSIFQRLHSKEEYEGTGIGLAHCKKIIEAHNGKIWLESTVGKGTTFFFTIPA